MSNDDDSSTLVGVLMDVSGSMEEALKVEDKHLAKDNVKRTHSLINVLVNVASQETTRHRRHDEVFVGAFGTVERDGICDLLHLLNEMQEDNRGVHHLTAGRGDGYDALKDLAIANNGQHAVYWVELKVLTEKEASFLYRALCRDRVSTKCLLQLIPRYLDAQLLNFGGILAVGDRINRRAADSSEAVKYAREVVKKYIDSMLVSNFTSRPLQATACLLEKSLKKKTPHDDNDDNYDQFFESLKDHIYGNTPLRQAIMKAKEVFARSKLKNKTLFIISDGESTDGDPLPIAEELRNNYGVKVVTCFLTDREVLNARSLVDKASPIWSKGATALFNMSSAVENSNQAVSCLVDAGWELPTSGMSRLFIRANNLAVVDEFSRVVIAGMANSCDALLDIIGKIDLAIYINRTNDQFTQPEQVGGTCYAHATGATFHLAMSRIVGRRGGVPPFESIRDELVAKFKSDGANIDLVMQEFAPQYRLQYNVVGEEGARKAINARRPVVATFHLSGKQWANFSEFYKRCKSGTLTQTELNKPRHNEREPGGHAVVLIRCDPKGLTFMNSWGQNWANGGLFHVATGTIPSLKFYDVFWTLDDLFDSEKEAYRLEAAKTARQVGNRFPSILEVRFECPSCRQQSPISEYDGHLLEATCPKCRFTFKPVDVSLKRGLYLNSQ